MAESPNPPVVLFSTTTDSVMLWATGPLVPTMVIFFVPASIPTGTRTLTVVRPFEGFGSKSTTMPPGTLVAVNVTSGANGEVEPIRGATLMADTASLPAGALTDVGARLSEKSPVRRTIICTAAARVVDPARPTMLRRYVPEGVVVDGVT